MTAPRLIDDAEIDVDYAREWNAAHSGDERRYFEPGALVPPGSWVRLNLRTPGGVVIAVGELGKAHRDAIWVERIGVERGPADLVLRSSVFRLRFVPGPGGRWRADLDSWARVGPSRELAMEIGQALRAQDLTKLAELLDSGVLVLEGRDPIDDRTLLLSAAALGKERVATWLLERGADPHARAGGSGLRHFAKRGNLSLAFIRKLDELGLARPTEVEAAAASAQAGAMKVGDAVSHAKFGAGVIQALVGAGDGQKATVQFAGEAAPRTLLSRVLTPAG